MDVQLAADLRFSLRELYESYSYEALVIRPGLKSFVHHYRNRPNDVAFKFKCPVTGNPYTFKYEKHEKDFRLGIRDGMFLHQLRISCTKGFRYVSVPLGTPTMVPADRNNPTGKLNSLVERVSLDDYFEDPLEARQEEMEMLAMISSRAPGCVVRLHQLLVPAVWNAHKVVKNV